MKTPIAKKTKVLKEMKTPQSFTLELPGETITTGPGTVPVSGASVTQTSIKEIASGFRKISRLRIFDSALARQN